MSKKTKEGAAAPFAPPLDPRLDSDPSVGLNTGYYIIILLPNLIWNSERLVDHLQLFQKQFKR